MRRRNSGANRARGADTSECTWLVFFGELRAIEGRYARQGYAYDLRAMGARDTRARAWIDGNRKVTSGVLED